MFARNQVPLLFLAAIFGAFACSWTDKDNEDFYKILVVGTVIGTLFGIMCTILGSLPLCYGVMKSQGKIIATVIMFIGVFVIFVPMIAGKAQADAAVDKACERCEASSDHRVCTDKEKSDLKNIVAGFGIYVAYVHGFGFVCIILGVTSAVLGCCICCKCRKMKEEDGGAPGGGDVPKAQVVGQVVGAPVNEEAPKATSFEI